MNIPTYEVTNAINKILNRNNVKEIERNIRPLKCYTRAELHTN
jgi:hypothetical protein